MGMVMDLSDHVVVLNFGKVIAQGRPAAVQADPEVVRAYLGSGDVADLRRRLRAGVRGPAVVPAAPPVAAPVATPGAAVDAEPVAKTAVPVQGGSTDAG